MTFNKKIFASQLLLVFETALKYLKGFTKLTVFCISWAIYFMWLSIRFTGRKLKRLLVYIKTYDKQHFVVKTSLVFLVFGGLVIGGLNMVHHTTVIDASKIALKKGYEEGYVKAKQVAKTHPNDPHTATTNHQNKATMTSLVKAEKHLKGDLQPDHKLDLKKVGTQHSKFVLSISKQAVRAGHKYGIFPSVILAQACIESNWGQSELAYKDNNYFGIKGSFHGNSVNYSTTEYYSTGKTAINANFAKYPSIQAGINANAYLIRNGVNWNPRIYSGAWRANAKTFYQATNCLGENYATSPVYAKTLDKVIQVYDLNQFDL
mgnify:CR=1 FL=1